jgi:hypothetical protein
MADMPSRTKPSISRACYRMTATIAGSALVSITATPFGVASRLRW